MSNNTVVPASVIDLLVTAAPAAPRQLITHLTQPQPQQSAVVSVSELQSRLSDSRMRGLCFVLLGLAAFELLLPAQPVDPTAKHAETVRVAAAAVEELQLDVAAEREVPIFIRWLFVVVRVLIVRQVEAVVTGSATNGAIVAAESELAAARDLFNRSKAKVLYSFTCRFFVVAVLLCVMIDVLTLSVTALVGTPPLALAVRTAVCRFAGRRAALRGHRCWSNAHWRRCNRRPSLVCRDAGTTGVCWYCAVFVTVFLLVQRTMEQISERLLRRYPLYVDVCVPICASLALVRRGCGLLHARAIHTPPVAAVEVLVSVLCPHHMRVLNILLFAAQNLAVAVSAYPIVSSAAAGAVVVSDTTLRALHSMLRIWYCVL